MEKTEDLKRADKFLKTLSADQKLAMALGMYGADETSSFDGDDDFDGSKSKGYYNSADDRTSVNGDWEEFSDDDVDEFDNFLTKKARKRRKLRKKLRKSGVSRKDARKQARKQIPRQSIKKLLSNGWEEIKKGGRQLGKLVVKATMVIPRASARGLLALNYRGMANKLGWVSKNDKKKWAKVKKKWGALGGKWSSFEKSVKIGDKKRPLFCGKKCKSKIAKKVKSNFSGANGYHIDIDKLNALVRQTNDEVNENDEYHNVVCAGACVTASLIATGGTVLATIGSLIGKGMESKSLKKQMVHEEKENKKQMKYMSEKDKKEMEIADKQIKAQLDPRNQIIQNDKLTKVQKKEALVELDKVLGTDDTRSKKKIMLFAGIGLVVVGVIALLLRKK